MSAKNIIKKILDSQVLTFDITISESNSYKDYILIDSKEIYSLWCFYNGSLSIDYQGIKAWCDLGLTNAHKILDSIVYLKRTL